MSRKKSLSRFLITAAVESLFLGRKCDLLRHESYKDRDEWFLYELEGFWLYIYIDRGDHYAELSPGTPTDRWKLSLVLEYLGLAKEAEPGIGGLSSLLKQLWLLSRNMARVRALFGEGNFSHTESKLGALSARKFERLVERGKRAAGS
jgi:hypothetical protein